MTTVLLVVFLLGVLAGCWLGVRRAEWGIARATARRTMTGRSSWRKRS